jgi:serine-type D-Ala-D-Ala carboxypeptidase (penicillin-binding protein 5/6)
MKFLRNTILICLSLIVITGSPTNSQAISAKGAILMEQHSGRVLYEKNAHSQMRIASITKIMTAIIAIESGKLNEMVKISPKAANTEGSSLYLKPTEKVKLIDLLYGLMLRSGNDAAVAIAEHVGGDLDGFVELMNKKAQEVGMKQTIFANPHGLDDHENHYSTAYDMALLTRYAMKNNTYAKIVGTKTYKSSSGSTWVNKNRLLTQLYRYSTGGKTGYTQRAKRTLVSTAAKENLELIAVTINDGNDWNDHIQLFNSAFDKYKLIDIVHKGPYTNLDDDFYTGKITTKNEYVYPLTESEIRELSLKVTLLKPEKLNHEVDISRPIGKVEILLQKEKIGELPLFITDLPDKQELPWWKKLKNKLHL